MVKKNLFYFALSLLIPFFVLLPYFLNGEPIENENYMFRAWFVTGVFSGLSFDNSFQWVSNISFGLPRAGNPLYGSFYLPAYLGAYINQPLSSYIVWLSSMSLGLIGSWKLFSLFTERRELAFLAGTAFILAGVLFNTSVITLYAERMIFIPWTLFFFWKGVRDDKIGLIVASSVLHALHFLASTSFTWFYVSASIVFFLLGYFIHLIRQSEHNNNVVDEFWTVFKIGGVFFCLCAALVLVQILPVLEYDSLAVHRNQPLSEYLKTGRFAPRTLFLAPFWFPGAFENSRQLFMFSNLSYLGWIPIFLGVLWASSTPRKQVGYLGLLLLCVIFAAASMTPIKEIIRAMPGMSHVRFTSFWMLAWNFIILVIAVKAGNQIGVSISTARAMRIALIVLALSGVTTLFLFFAKGAPASLELMRPLIVGAGVCFLFVGAQKWQLKPKTILQGLAVIALLDASSWAVKVSLRDKPESNIYTVTLNDIRAPQAKDILQVGGFGQGRALALCSPDGKGVPYRLNVSGSRMEWAFTFSSYPLRRSWEIVRRLGYSQSTVCEREALRLSANEFFTEERLNLTRSLNIRYYFLDGQADKEFVEALGFKFITHDAYSGYDLYEDVEAFSRAVWYSDARIVNDVDEALLALGAKSSLSQNAIVEIKSEDVPDWLKNPTGLVSTRINYQTKYQATKVVVSGKSKEPGVLVLSDVDYPGWIVTVDGEKAEMFPTNIVGRGVFLPAGEHVVTFEYRPWLLWIGMLVSSITWLGVIAYGFRSLWRYRKSDQFLGNKTMT